MTTAPLMRRIDLRNAPTTPRDLADLLPRADVDVDAALEAVRPIIDQVRRGGSAALLDLSERFDRVRPAHLRVPDEALRGALAELDPEVRTALETAISHTRLAHRAQLPVETSTEITPGGFVAQRWIPVQRVGLYVPGGLAVYPSSVVMNVVAAQVAGVPELAVASPPQEANDGLPHPVILAACALLGISEVYAVGGAQAVAMFAYGVRDTEPDQGGDPNDYVCPPVDVVTGPGNIYVAAAKRAVIGTVGIDSEAGTTEIAVIADVTANPTYLAADLISQAEHDPAAASVLITDSPDLAAAVDQEIERRVASSHHIKRITTALSGPQSATVLVEDMTQAVAVANAYAAEHLEIQSANPQEVAANIHNAGAIFIGPHSPVPLGDYLAGSNHVLPTGGTARFASGLGVGAYLKSVQVVEYSADALAALERPLRALALAEDLPAHADALAAREE